MSPIDANAVRHERPFTFSPREIFAAFEAADRIARWWGPAGFTNTFQQFALEVGSHWLYVMHGPTNADFPNESIVRELVRDSKIVIEHISAPHFTLTVTLTPRDGGTQLVWHQAFDSAEFAEKMRPIVEPANEQNLDRLQAFLERR